MSSPLNYPPHQPAPPAPRPGMSTGKKVALGCGIPLVLVLAFAGGCAVLAGTAVNEIDKQVRADKSDDVRAAKEDVKIVSCKVVKDDILGPNVEAKVKVTNHGKKRANYYVQGEFLDEDGNQFDTLDSYVRNLAPGSSTTQDFTGTFVPGELQGVDKGTCKILDVSRDEFLAANN